LTSHRETWRVPSDEVNACVANNAKVGRTRIVSDVMDWFLDYPPREGLNLNTHSIVFQRGISELQLLISERVSFPSEEFNIYIYIVREVREMQDTCKCLPSLQSHNVKSLFFCAMR